MMTLLSQFAPRVHTVRLSNLVGWSLYFPLSLPKKQIEGYGKAVDMQMWERRPMPEELSRIRSMDEWSEMPREFRQKFSAYIEEEFRRRRGAFGAV